MRQFYRFLRYSLLLALVNSMALAAAADWPDLDEPEYKKGTIGQEAEWESFEDVSKVRLVPPRYSGELIDIELDMPLIGKVVFRSVKGASGKEGMEGVVTFPPEPIKLGPLTIDNKGIFSFVDGVISFTGSARFDFGGKVLEAKIGMRELKFAAGADTEVPASGDNRRRSVRLVESCLFGIEFVGGAKDLEIIPGFPIVAKSLDLVLSSGKSPSIALHGFIAQEPAVLMVTVSEKALKMEGAVGQCKLTNLAPFLAGTLLEDFSFDGQWRLSTDGMAYFEGRMYGKTPEDKAVLEVIPGVKASFDSIVFDYKKDRSADITIKTTFMDAPVVYTGRYDSKTKDLSLNGDLKGLKLTNVIPMFADTDFKAIVFDATLNLSAKKGLKITGGLQDSTKEVNLYGLKLRKIFVDLNTDKKRGTVVGALTALGVPASANFGLDWSKKPGLALSAGFDQTVTSWQPFLLIPAGDGKYDFLRAITIDNPKLRLSFGLAKVQKKKEETKKVSDKKTAETIEKSDQYEMPESEYIALDELRTQGSHLMFIVSGRANAGKLFADTVKEAGKAANLKKDVIAKVPVRELNVDALFKIEFTSKKEKAEKPFTIVGYLSMPEGFALTTILPSREDFIKDFGKENGTLLYELFDFVKMDYGKFVVCLKDEEIDGVVYPAGISVDTNIVVGKDIQQEVLKSLKFMKDFFDKKGDRGMGAHFMFKLDPLNLKNFVLKIGASTGDFTVSIPKVLDVGPFDFSQAALDFVMRGDGLGLETSFAFLPHGDPNQKPITFAGELKGTATALAGELGAAGIWRNPFGIGKIFRGGFTVGDLGFKLSETYESILAIPETFGASLLAFGALGLSGKVTIGKTSPIIADVFFKIGLDVTDLALEMRMKNAAKVADILQGFLEGLGIADALKIDLNKLVMGNVEEVFLKFAPFGGNISNITISSGVGGAFYGDIFGARFGAELTLDTTGIVARGYLPDIKIGPLVLTQAGGASIDIRDQIKKNFENRAPTQIGPEFNLTLSLKKLPQFKINGEVRLDLPNANGADVAIFKGLTDIEISPSRLAFTSETQIGPKEVGLTARIKGTTLHVDKPMELLKEIQPKNLGLEIEFTNTLSKRLSDDLDRDYNNLVAQLDLTYKQFIEQVDRATTDQEVREQEARWRAASRDPAKALDAINEWIKWRYVASKRDLEKVLDPLGTTREFMKRIGMNKLFKDVARDLTGSMLAIAKAGKTELDKAGKLLVINKIYWKGTVSDLVKGIIPGVMVDLSIGDKHYQEVIGDLDLNPDKIGWSLTQTSLALTRIAARVLGQMLGTTIAVPPCAPNVLVEFQNQREDLAVSIKDQTGIQTVVPWRDQKPYVSLDILCQKRADLLAKGESGDADNTYIVSVNNRPVAQVKCIYGVLGQGTVSAVVSQIGTDGKITEKYTQVNYGEKWADFVPDGVSPFTLKTVIVSEGLQTKIKFYLQEISEACGAKVLVEAINQRPDLRVTIKDYQYKQLAIPDSSKRVWVAVDAICRQQQSVSAKTYTVYVEDRALADVTCSFGPAIDEYIQATITPAPGVTGSAEVISQKFRGQVGGDAITAPLVAPDRSRLVLKVETIKELGQSKCKIYIQSCSRNIPVEAQNQTGLSIKVRTSRGKEFDVPNVKQTAYITVDTICQFATESVEDVYTILVNNTPVADIFCRFGALSTESHEALIYDYPYAVGKQPLSGSSTWGFCSSFTAVGLKLKVEPIWESGIHKFKFYFQPLGVGC